MERDQGEKLVNDFLAINLLVFIQEKPQENTEKESKDQESSGEGFSS
jgi:hypothetical protein